MKGKGAGTPDDNPWGSLSTAHPLLQGRNMAGNEVGLKKYACVGAEQVQGKTGRSGPQPDLDM